jgi:uncharacterized protein YndB with AHSA1/START domain
MTSATQAAPDAYAAVTEPATLTIRRLLPAPVERVWAYLTEAELRRRWLADGVMDLTQGAGFELVWRNDSLSTPSDPRPDGFPAEHRMESRILEVRPPVRLVFSWGTAGGSVAFDLTPSEGGTLLTVTHRRLAERDAMLSVSAGWHIHLDVLAARLAETPLPSFWSGWKRLKDDYAARLPG